MKQDSHAVKQKDWFYHIQPYGVPTPCAPDVRLGTKIEPDEFFEILSMISKHTAIEPNPSLCPRPSKALPGRKLIFNNQPISQPARGVGADRIWAYQEHI